jgi:hypothetical protein
MAGLQVAEQRNEYLRRQYTHAVVAAKFSVLLDLAMTVNAIEKMLVKAIIA